MVPNRYKKFRMKRLTWVDIAFLHFKAALAWMLYGPLMEHESFTDAFAGTMFVVWQGMTVAGFLISVGGLLLGAQKETLRHTGFRIELVGLWLILSGPLAFLGFQIGLAFNPGPPDPSGLSLMFPYLVVAAILARMAMVKAAMNTVLYRFPGERHVD